MARERFLGKTCVKPTAELAPVVVLVALLLSLPCLIAAQLMEGAASEQQSGPQQQLHQEILVQPNSRVRIECRLPQLSTVDKRTYYWSFQRGPKWSRVLCFETKCLEESSLGFHLDVQPETNSYDLLINNATYELNDGLYSCYYKDETNPEAPQTSITREFRLTVLIPPQPPLIVAPSQQPAREGVEHQLSCISQGGNPEPKMSWFRNEQALVPGQGLRIEQTHLNGTTTSTLSWTAAMDDHQASYRCQVWNKAMSSAAHERELKLQVEYAPRITVGPHNPLKALHGQPITLSCQVDANPGVKGIRWFRDGHLISNQFNYTIQETKLSDSTVFSCQADNGISNPLHHHHLFGSDRAATHASQHQSPTAVEAQLQVQVLYGPRVQVKPSKASALSEGDFVVLNCSVDSWPPPYEIVWTRHDDPTFRRLSTQLLEFQPVTASDMANYTCTAFNRLDPSGYPQLIERQGSASALLQVRHKPGLAEISLGQAGETEVGSKTLIQCRAKPPGFPEPQFKFWKFPSPQASQKLYLNKQALGSVYTIYSAKPDDEAKYGCLAFNEMGSSTEADGDLVVNEPPAIIHDVATRRDQDARAQGDAPYSITVRASSKPKPRVTWIHRSPVDGRRIELNSMDLNSRFEVKTQADQEPGLRGKYNVISSLIFKSPLEIDDRGLYSVEISNGLSRSAVEDFQLHINHAPIPAPKGQPILVSQSNSLSGQPQAKIKAGFDLGETVNLTCRVSAYPRPDFLWYANSAADSDKPIDTNPRFRATISNPLDDIWESTLTFSQAQESDYGDYMCVTANHDQQSNRMSDSLQIMVTLTRKTIPDPPSQLEAIDATQDSITLQWLAGFDGGFAQNQYLVQYAPDDGSEMSLSKRFPSTDSAQGFITAMSLGNQANALGELSVQDQTGYPKFYDCLSINPCTINQLQARQGYVFRLRAKNERGLSESSEELRASTRANLSQTPRVLEAAYDSSANLLRIQLEPGSEYLLSNLNARVDIRSLAQPIGSGGPLAQATSDSANQLEMTPGEWRTLTRVQMRQERDQAPIAVQADREQLRVSLCSRQNESVCGPEYLVNMRGSFLQDHRGLSMSIFVSTLTLIVLLGAFATSVHSCCSSRRKAKKAQSVMGIERSDPGLDNKSSANGGSATGGHLKGGPNGSHAGSTTSTNSTTANGANGLHSMADSLNGLGGLANGATSDHSSDHSRQAKLDSMLPPNYNHYADRASIMMEQQQQQQQQQQQLEQQQMGDKLGSIFGLANQSLLGQQQQQASPMALSGLANQFTYGQIDHSQQPMIDPSSMMMLGQNVVYDQAEQQQQLWPTSQVHDDYSYNTLAYSASQQPAMDLHQQMIEPTYGSTGAMMAKPTGAYDNSGQFQPYAPAYHQQQAQMVDPNQQYQQEMAAAQQQMYGTLTRNGYQQSVEQDHQGQQQANLGGGQHSMQLDSQQHYGTLGASGLIQPVLGPPLPPQESDYETTGARNGTRLIREIIV